MKKKEYIRPTAEVINVKLAGSVLEDDLIIPISGETTPEESDAKKSLFDDWDDGSSLSGQRNLWED